MASSGKPCLKRGANRTARLLDTLESRLMFSVFTPTQIRQAYGIDGLNGDGSGQTIAIVEAYHDPNLVNDLNVFDQQFSINGTQSLYSQYGAASNFLTQTSLTSSWTVNSGWSMETALDVEWAHAVAPAAKIAVVEAKSAGLNDLMAAVDYARNLTNVSVVSMSWGIGDFSTETSYDSHFTTPAGHTNITFVASSGDSGAGVSWPAIASNVLSVGGTSLTLAADGTYAGESAWSGSGGGYSAYETKPAYQNAVNPTGFRSNPDVAYNADPNTGFYVYNTDPTTGGAGWSSVGGTSAGAPQWAALIAIADQGRATSLTTSQTLKTLYAMPAANFHDVTTGSNGYAAKTGYDLATGLGSPIANFVVPGLTGSTVATSTSDYSGSTTTTTTTTPGNGNKGKKHASPVSHQPVVMASLSTVDAAANVTVVAHNTSQAVALVQPYRTPAISMTPTIETSSVLARVQDAEETDSTPLDPALLHDSRPTDGEIDAAAA